MSIKNIVVVDTVGNVENISKSFKDNFPFVAEWHGYEATNDAGNTPHPHGGMCMGQILLPLWNDTDKIIAHFIRLFNSSGRVVEEAFGQWTVDKISEISKTGPTFVNNSWGNYIANGDTSKFTFDANVWRKMINETGVTVMWASGNNGDFDPDVDEEVPQGLLTDISSKIAAADRDSKPSIYSGDSVNAPPTATFWSTRIHLLNPVTSKWDMASGTSFAAPKATGLCAKRNLSHYQFVELAKTSGQRPCNYAGKLPHPKWGWGWLEEEYQKEIVGCPYTYSSQPSILDEESLIWFDFELRYSNKIGDQE